MALASDIPRISASNYPSTAYTPNITTSTSTTTAGGSFLLPGAVYETATDPRSYLMAAHKYREETNRKEDLEDMAHQAGLTRFVRVLIVDPDENIPLQDRMLFSGEEKLTDLTDQELFFELDIRTLLAAHNEKRVKVVNKSVKDRTETLEPAKVCDLRMVVVNIARF